MISPDDPNNCPDKVIHLIKVKTDALQIAEVLDQDIYHKALEIISNPVNTNLKNAMNLRMGGFNAERIFTSLISKRFLDGGLKDLVIEARLLVEGSTKLALM